MNVEISYVQNKQPEKPHSWTEVYEGGQTWDSSEPLLNTRSLISRTQSTGATLHNSDQSLTLATLRLPSLVRESLRCPTSYIELRTLESFHFP